MPKPTVVLVHGAWADASSWNAVASELQNQGFTVLAPPNLLRAVAIDAPYITSFIAQRTSGPVVLVAHSYGGFVITNAAGGADNVKALVYVDAFIPDEGETVFQILGGSGSAFDIPDPTAVFDIVGYPGAPEGDAEAFLKPDTVHNSFAQDLPEADRRLIAAGQRPITLGANTTPSGPGAWTASSRPTRSGAWPSVQVPPSPRSPAHTSRWCHIPRSRSTPSSPPSRTSATEPPRVV
jgi:pimeloyl-ACP methyl ester carboxylesterase